MNADNLQITIDATLMNKLAAIEKLCRANNNPSVNVATHALANRILKIIEGKEQEP